MPYTVVAFHAHPDDEALLTGGTLARAAAEGHRVVLVVATDGGAGASSARIRRQGALGERRRTELAQAARALGVARIVWLGFDDSGSPEAPSGAPRAFATADLDEAARALAGVLTEERADLMLGYDAAGGYGHPDHVAVHRVGRRAAELTITPLLEATVDRDALLRALAWLHRLPGVPSDFHPDRFRAAYTERAQLTHRIDVRRYADQKRAAMAAHASQAEGDADIRTLRLLLRLPRPVFRGVLGVEWYMQVGQPSGVAYDDIFATLGRRRTDRRG